MTALLVPAIFCAILIYGLHKKVDIYDALTCGIREGLQVCAGIFPALVTMLTLITMLRASGAIDLLAHFLAPIVESLGMPADCLPLALLRPFSGGGALAVGSAVMEQAGPDSLSGRIAAVMLGSSDTSFYTIAVYFGAAGVQKSRYAVPAALIGDMAGMAAAIAAVKLLF